MELKKLRKEHKKTQKEIAEILGISQNGYSLIENGGRKLSVENAKALAEIYQIDWWKLFEE